MNRSAYLATGKMIGLMKSLSKIRVITNGQENIPEGSIIFVVNHFTRIETMLLPYHIYGLTKVPVWSLADHSLFEGALGGFLEQMGTLSTRNPDRDRLIVKSLLTGEANWIIFPEGEMVKDKATMARSGFFGLRSRLRAHTGAASLALRTEFYRQRLRLMLEMSPGEASRLQKLFQIEDLEPVLDRSTWIVPVNMTYYPVRSRENLLSELADHFAGEIPERLHEELLTEGTMFFKGVDIDLRFGRAIPVRQLLSSSAIGADIRSNAPINFDDRLPSRQALKQAATTLMQSCMSSIYGMTTVNHDHLFASMLKAMPFNRINEADFRRRVFLLTGMISENEGIFRHSSLESLQTPLLTDDRYHKYRDFLELALKTGLLELYEGTLIRDNGKFSRTGDMHRIRIDNPLAVSANEVATLSSLQKQVRLLAWLPGMLVRKRVADLLLRQALEEYESDSRRFRNSGEIREHEVGKPILLKGRSRELGVVLVHGLLAAPREMRELAHRLHDRGYWVYAARLKGHATSPEDLSTRTGSDWTESLDLAHALMSATCKRVVMGGFSFGGGMALDAAARIGNLAGVFAVCPPFRLQDISSRLAPAVTTWNRLMDILHTHGKKKEYVDIVPEYPQTNYNRLPVAALWEMEKFMKELEQRLEMVQIPVLVVQASGDPVVDPDGTALLFNRLGTERKEYLTFDFDRHGILNGDGSQQVHNAVVEFVDRLRRG